MSLPNIRVSVDAVVFGYDSKEGLSVLLIKRKVAPHLGEWALPGGLVLEAESLETAVHRELREETGITVSYLEQLYTFGTPGRDPRNRVITVAYYGLVRQAKFDLYAATDAADAKWFHTNKIPKLAFDHREILDIAAARLRSKLSYEPVGFELLDEKFRFSDLHKLYEIVYGRQIERRNFKKKFLQLDILEQLSEKVSQGRGRPGALFKFDQKKYFALKQRGMLFQIT